MRDSDTDEVELCEYAVSFVQCRNGSAQNRPVLRHYYITFYTVPRRDGVDLISRGRHKLKRGNIGVAMICMSLGFCYCCRL